MAYSATLRSLLCTTRDTEALLLAFVAAFDALVSDPSSLSASEITSLDWYGDGVVGYDDRDYWLDWIIGRDWSITERLPFAEAAPTTKDESDPLGLFGVWANSIVIDPLNTAARYVNHASSNPCYTNVGRTAAASPLALFTNTSITGVYNVENTIWGDARSLVGDSGNSSRFRFPKTGAEVAVYFRGGTYELDRVLTFIKEDGSATANTRIIIRNYPGEVVDLQCGAYAGTNVPIFTVSRPDLSIHLSMLRGRRGSVGSYVFAPFLISVTNAADRFRMSGEIANCRAIAPTHPDAATLPGYVDSVFTSRTLSSEETTAKMLDYAVIQMGVGNDSSNLEDLIITPAGDDFPRSVSVPGGDVERDFGDTVDVAGCSNLTIRRVSILGTSSHQALQIRVAGDGTVADGLLMEYCDIRNPENSCVGLYANNSIVRYNRIRDFGTRTGAQDAGGFQIGHGNNLDLYGNVIWLNDDQASGQTYGIDIAVSQSDATMSFVNSSVDENILYRCGMSYGYSSSAPASDLGRVHDNSLARNIFYGLSDYAQTVDAYDAPISTNLGPHSATMYATVLDGNLIYRTDGDLAMIVERLPVTGGNPTGAPTDWPNVAVSPWFVNVANADPEFASPSTGDFTMRNASPGHALMDAEAPLVDTDLSPDPYDCALVPQYFPRVNLFGGSAVEV